MDRKKIGLTGVATALLLVTGGYFIVQSGDEMSRDQNDQVTENSQTSDKSKQDEIISSAHEELDTEEIIVKIMEDGYITVNGGHYHFHRGNIPADALFSETLLAPADYIFKSEDAVAEINGGYIVKISDEYYVYLKNPNDRDNIRSEEEIEHQAEETKAFVQAHRQERIAHEKATAGKTLFGGRNIAGHYTTDDGYIFSPTDIIDDLGDGYLVPHGDHFHFIPKADLSASERVAAERFWSGRHGDNSVVHASSRSGGQSHRYQANQPANDSWRQLAKKYEIESGTSYIPTSRPSTSSSATPGAPKLIGQKDNKDDQVILNVLADLYATPASPKRGNRQGNIEYTRHVEGDGLVFDPLDIAKDIGYAYVIPHGDHFHVIPYSWLSDLERLASELVLDYRHQNKSLPSRAQINQLVAERRAKKNKPITSHTDNKLSTSESKKTENPVVSDETGRYGLIGKKAPNGNPATPLTDRQGKANHQIVYSVEEVEFAKARGKYTTSDGYIFDSEDVTEDLGDGFVVPHMDHIHYIPKNDLKNSEIKASLKHLAQMQGKKESDDIDIKLESEQSHTVIKSLFKAENVKAFVEKDGKEGYIFTHSNQEYFIPETELNLQERAFAEQQLNMNSGLQRVFEIAPIKEGDLQPGLYAPISTLPMHAGTATVDTGEHFVIPHIDHIHLVFYKNLSNEQIATIQYLMQHPEYRPAPWTDAGHDQTTSTEIKYVPNVTPKNKRSGMKNWQIIHSADEVNKALQAGNYANDEGYIFSPVDLLDKKTVIYSDGSWSIPKANGTSYVSFSKKDIAVQMHEAVDQTLEKRQQLENQKEKINESKKEVSNKELIAFLAEYFELPKTAIIFRFSDNTFVVKAEKAFEVAKEDATRAYLGELSLRKPTDEEERQSEKPEESAKTEQRPDNDLASDNHQESTEKSAESETAETETGDGEVPIKKANTEEEMTNAEKLAKEKSDDPLDSVVIQ